MTLNITPAISKAYEDYLNEAIDHDFMGTPILRRSTYPYQMEPDSGLVGFAAGYQTATLAQSAELVALRQKVSENELMAGCAVMLRDDLIDAAIVSEAVPPMMLTEAILRYVSALRKDAERYRYIRSHSYVELACDSPRVPDWTESALDVETDKAMAAELGKAVQPPSLICPTCKADRLKEDCKGIRSDCGLKVAAQAVKASGGVK